MGQRDQRDDGQHDARRAATAAGYPHGSRLPARDKRLTNGKIEAFWATLQAEVLDRGRFADLAAAEAAVVEYAGYYNYHRLHGEIGWLTPAERYDGTPFTDRGFENIPPVRGVADLLTDLLRAA